MNNSELKKHIALALIAASIPTLETPVYKTNKKSKGEKKQAARELKLKGWK